MSHINNNRRKLAAPAAVALLLLPVSLGLAACGGSSSTTSTSANASATTPGGAAGRGATGPSGAGPGATGPGGAGPGAKGPGAKGPGATGPSGARFKALRECLQKNGITLPKRTPGQRPPGGAGGFLGGSAGGPQLPSGVTRAQYEAAIKKCGGGAFANRGARLKNPAFLAALTKFATCMRENGVNVPPPNTSGNGPIFSIKGIDTTSAKFKTAEAKCRSDLAGAFRRGPGATGAAGAPGAPGGPPPGGPEGG